MLELKYNEQGLIPVVVQSAVTGRVLMQAFADELAVKETLSSGFAVFYSRSRKSRWRKGDTSGNSQKILDVRVDCDADSLLYLVEEAGPACHTGNESCYYRRLNGEDIELPMSFELTQALYEKIQSRCEERPAGSYVVSLFDRGADRIIQKVGEEATETVIALKNREAQPIISEAADLIFHLMIALVEQGIPLSRINEELIKRYK